MKTALCFVILMSRWLLRLRVYENNVDLVKEINKIKLVKGRCLFCRRCRLMWYLANAIKQKDPYKIVEIYSIIDDGGEVNKSTELSEYISESFAWSSRREWGSINCKKSVASDIIFRWRAGEFLSNEAGRIATTPSRLQWPLFVVLGAIRESSGDEYHALDYYRKAYKIIPKWLPEAKGLYEKINNLRMIDR